MGMYTELVAGFRVDSDKHPEVISVLKAMVDDKWKGVRRDEVVPALDHPFFRTDRWQWMLRHASYYFPVSKSFSAYKDDKHFPETVFSIRCNLKNYSNEIELFWDWIGPFIDGCDGDLVGYDRYEEPGGFHAIYKTPNGIKRVFMTDPEGAGNG